MRFMSTNNTKVLLTAITLATAAVMTFEGYSSKPYRDVAGILTDCYGNTYNVSESRIRTKSECEALLNTEVARVGKIIYRDREDIPVSVLTAGISLVYNIGEGAYRSSTFRKHLRAGNFESACYQIPRWKYITVQNRKVVSRGLVNRRTKELEICLEDLNK